MTDSQYFQPAPEGGQRLSKSQPLEANLLQLATNPEAAIRAYGADWAGWCAASALDALAAASRFTDLERRVQALEKRKPKPPATLMTFGGKR